MEQARYAGTIGSVMGGMNTPSKQPQMRTIDGLLIELQQRIDDIASGVSRTKEFRHRLLNATPEKEVGPITEAENPVTVESRIGMLIRRAEKVAYELRQTVTELESAA